MNNTRRKNIAIAIEELEGIKEKIETLLEEEQEYFDNMPENLQQSEKAEKAENAISSLENAMDSIDESVSSLEESKD